MSFKVKAVTTHPAFVGRGIELIGTLDADLFAKALDAGVKDEGYETPSDGWVYSFDGESTFKYNKKKYKAIGNKPVVEFGLVTVDGFIEIEEIGQ